MKRFIFIIGFIYVLTIGQGFSENIGAEAKQMAMAAQLFLDGSYDASADLFQKFIQAYPQNPQTELANLYLAKCYYFKKNYPRSFAVLSELIACPKGQFIDEAYYWLAQVCLQSNDYNDSFFYAMKIITNFKQSRFFWLAQIIAGEADYKLGRKIDADAIWRVVAENSADLDARERAYEKLFEIYRAEQDIRLASLCRDYLADNPQGIYAGNAYFYLGKITADNKKYDDAINNYAKALRLSSHQQQSDMILKELGMILLEKKDYSRARAMFSEINDLANRGYLSALYFMRIGDYAQAIEIFDNFIKNFPDNSLIAQAFLNKADALYQAGRINDALYLYQYINRTFNDKEHENILGLSRYGLAWVYQRLGNIKKSLEEFSASLPFLRDPVLRANAFLQLAGADMNAGKYKTALKKYLIIIKNSSITEYTAYARFQAGIAYLYLRQWPKAIECFKICRQNKTYAGQAGYYLAKADAAIGDNAAAESLLKEFLKNEPADEKNFDARYILGKCYLEQKQYQRAIDTLRSLSEQASGQIQEAAMLDLAAALFEFGRPLQAQELWEKFLKLFPQSVYAGDVVFLLAQKAQKEQDDSTAIKRYLQITSNSTNDGLIGQAKFNLGQLYRKQGDLKSAEKYFLEVSADSALLSIDAKFCLADMYRQNNRLPEAVSMYDEVIKKYQYSGRVSDALLEKADVLMKIKDFSAAAKAFNQAIIFGRDSAKIRFFLGICLEKQGLLRQAIVEYSSAIKKNDSEYDIKAKFRAAKNYENLKEPAQARMLYAEIAAVDCSESEVAKERLAEIKSEK